MLRLVLERFGCLDVRLDIFDGVQRRDARIGIVLEVSRHTAEAVEEPHYETDGEMSVTLPLASWFFEISVTSQTICRLIASPVFARSQDWNGRR